MSERKRGGQPGNKNAVGNRGGGAPTGNQNGRTHGGYSRLWPLSDEETEMIGTMEYAPEKMLEDEIAMLTVRERRIFRLISQYEHDQLVVSEVKRSEEKREFSDESECSLYTEIVNDKIASGDWMPGHPYHLTTTSEAGIKIIILLEGVLSRIQDQKRRAIDSLARYRRESGISKNDSIVNDWVQAVLESSPERINQT